MKAFSRKTSGFDPSNGLLPEGTFWIIIDRERSLADRGSRKLAILAIDVVKDSQDGELARRVRKAVLRRLRKSDVAGWLDDSRVGVLLSEARVADAERVASAICDQVAAEGVRPHCQIFEYPAPFTRGGDAGSPPLGKSLAGADEVKRTEAHEGTGADSTADSRVSRISVVDAQGTMDLLTPPVPIWKRALDSTVAGLALILLSPLFAAVSLFICIASPGPIFFRQYRIGRAGRPFPCWKFRTMHVDADHSVHARHVSCLISSSEPMKKLDGARDSRVIPGGRLIRASGLDELPQLINVLRGDMSLVGPRPCIAYEYEKFEPWHRRRCDTLPGITGLWQVSGKNLTTFNEMMRYDVAYASRLTAGSDLRILLRTIPAVVSEVRRSQATHHGGP